MNQQVEIDQLDSEIFVCCKCGGEFSHIEGTWLPIGEEESKFMKLLSEPNAIPRIYAWDLRKPEIITSDKFTCYDCAG